jgi:hypothetical protein
MREHLSLPSTAHWNICGAWFSFAGPPCSVRALGAERSLSGLPSDAVGRLGYPVCPACKRCPRRSDSKFCGVLCEVWAIQQHWQQQQQQQQLQAQQHRQQEHHQRHHHQQRQHWQSPTMGPPPTVPVTWSNAARGTVSPAAWQVPF